MRDAPKVPEESLYWLGSTYAKKRNYTLKFRSAINYVFIKK